MQCSVFIPAVNFFLFALLRTISFFWEGLRGSIASLCPVLGPSLLERHRGPGACPEKGSKAGQGSGAQAL